MVWKFCGKAQFPHSFWAIRPKLGENCPFPQNFHSMKLGEITVFYALKLFTLSQVIFIKRLGVPMNTFQNDFSIGLREDGYEFRKFLSN